MAKHLEKFTKPFQDSRIPFLLVEVLTNGAGEMVDLVCRYANSPAADLVNLSAADLRGQRFTRLFPSQRLSQFHHFSSVAFSGSSISFPYTTVLGQNLTVTCYQPMYGLVACILDPTAGHSRDPMPAGTLLPAAVAVLELSRSGTKCLSFNQQFCQLCGFSRRELLNRGGDFTFLVEPEDRTALLQALLDAGRGNQQTHHEFRLVRKDLPSIWVRLQAQALPQQGKSRCFYAVIMDIDLQQRSQVQLTQALKENQSLEEQVERLFSHLPGEYGLFRLAPGADVLQTLQISDGLSDLLGVSREKLVGQLAADPLFQVFPADREELIAAALRAQSIGFPLHHFCRLQTPDGPMLWISVRAVWQPQPDGGQLVYVTCSDVTELRETQAALTVQSRVATLLLERSQLVSLDYDPAEDVAQISYFEGGRQVSRTIPEYLSHLSDSPAIHPQDRRRLAASIRRAVTRPSAEVLEYRGDYGTGVWRWYRVCWASLFDERGNVRRLLGKAEDITLRKVAQARQQSLLQQQKHLTRRALLCLRLDLTEDRILSAGGTRARAVPLSPGDTADSCLLHLQQCVPDPAEQARFQDRFRRQALLETYHSGILHVTLQHALIFRTDAIKVRSLVELTENPDTLHVEAFYHIADFKTLCEDCPAAGDGT